ncbi:hypothetical protein O1Y96_004722, partial [Raoultella ornithinolytica]
IGFWFRCFTNPATLAGSSAQSAHASGVWGRAVYLSPDDERLKIKHFRPVISPAYSAAASTLAQKMVGNMKINAIANDIYFH